jgi:hypothetical protein
MLTARWARPSAVCGGVGIFLIRTSRSKPTDRKFRPVPNQKVCLIESPAPEPAGMQGHRQNNIDTVFIPKKHKGRQEKFTERPGQLDFAPVFKTVDDFRDNPIVHQRCPGNAKFFAGGNACAAIVILPLPARKRYAAANAKRRFNRNQF